MSLKIIMTIFFLYLFKDSKTDTQKSYLKEFSKLLTQLNSKNLFIQLINNLNSFNARNKTLLGFPLILKLFQD